MANNLPETKRPDPIQLFLKLNLLWLEVDKLEEKVSWINHELKSAKFEALEIRRCVPKKDFIKTVKKLDKRIRFLESKVGRKEGGSASSPRH